MIFSCRFATIAFVAAITIACNLNESSPAASLVDKSLSKLEWNSRATWKQIYNKVFSQDYVKDDPMKPEETMKLLLKLQADMKENPPSLGTNGVRYVVSLPEKEQIDAIAKVDSLKSWPGTQESSWIDIFGIYKKLEKIDELIEGANLSDEKCHIFHIIRMQDLYSIEYSAQYVNLNPLLESIRRQLFEFCGNHLADLLELQEIPKSKLDEVVMLQNLVKQAGEPKPHQQITRSSLLEAATDYAICRKLDITQTDDSPSDIDEDESFTELPVFSPVCKPVLNDETGALLSYYDDFREYIDPEAFDLAWKDSHHVQDHLGYIRICDGLNSGLVTRKDLEGELNIKLKSGADENQMSCQAIAVQ